jgi:DNA topoisomerase-2
MVKEKRYVKEYSEYHTDELVSFLITPTSHDVIDSDKHIIERFKLEDQLHLRNMSAFDAQGALRKFGSPFEIMDEFYSVRLRFYERRKQWKTSELSDKVRRLVNQTRFASAVIDGNLKLLNQPRSAVLEQLDAMGFDRVEGSYSYLLSTSLLHLTLEHIEKLNQEAKEQQEALNELQSTSPQSMWISDLDKLEEAIRTDSAFTEPPLIPGSKPKIPTLPQNGKSLGSKSKKKTSASSRRKGSRNGQAAIPPVTPKPMGKPRLVIFNTEDQL